MRLTYLFITIAFFLTAACFSSPEEKRIREKINSYGKNTTDEDTDDYDIAELINDTITSDSLSKILYRMIVNSDDMSSATLIKNTEFLIDKGAQPNIVLTMHSKSRKTGSYIPLIKSFYRNKYRYYTYISSPFHAAVMKRRIELVKKMLDLGAKTNIPANDKYPIDLAVKQANKQMILLLLDNGSDINNVSLRWMRDINLIEELVKRGADPKSINLDFALTNAETLTRLIALMPDLNGLKLDFKILFSDEGQLGLLLDHGLPLNTIGNSFDKCPLIFGAIKYGNMQALELLISKGAKVSTYCHNGVGEKPILMAIHENQTDIVAFLLEKGANPNQKKWTKESALSFAIETDNDRIINLLIDAGAKIDYNGHFSQTPLMLAAHRGKYISAQTLISRGANINYRSEHGKTPLIIAIEKKDYPIIKLLVENGAKTNIKYEGKTLAEYAVEKKASPTIIDYLKNL